MDLADNDLASAQWVAIQAAWGGCAYCGAPGVPLQKDCVLPISRGGRYTLRNVVPACRSCNASKGNEEVTNWLRRKHLDEGAFLLRLHEITEALVAEVGGVPAAYPLVSSETISLARATAAFTPALMTS